MFKNINVSITGADTAERELMSNVITKALVTEGYSNVALVNTVGEPMVGSDVQSLADVLRRNHPDFLERTVRVWSIPVADGEEMSLEELKQVPEAATKAFAYVPEIDANSTVVVLSENGDNSAQDIAYRFEHDFIEDNGYEYGSDAHRQERKANVLAVEE
jgi:hypothetical protein